MRDQGDKQVGERKQTAPADPGRRPRTNAGFGVIYMTPVCCFVVSIGNFNNLVAKPVQILLH